MLIDRGKGRNIVSESIDFYGLRRTRFRVSVPWGRWPAMAMQRAAQPASQVLRRGLRPRPHARHDGCMRLWPQSRKLLIRGFANSLQRDSFAPREP